MSQPTLDQMLNHRLHIGHLSSKWNPRFAPFILTKKNNRHIIDLRKTQQCLQEAVKKMQEIVQRGGRILFVGTKKQARSAIIEASKQLEATYIVERWLGGTLTNFGTIYKSIKKMSKMDELQNDIAYKNLTKKEQLISQGKRLKLERNLAGIKDLKRPPQALFVVDIKREATAIQEATKLGMPIFAIVDTNTNPELVDYPIPANDDAKASISLILEYIIKEVKPSLQAWKEAKLKPPTTPEEPSKGQPKAAKSNTSSASQKATEKVESKAAPQPTKKTAIQKEAAQPTPSKTTDKAKKKATTQPVKKAEPQKEASQPTTAKATSEKTEKTTTTLDKKEKLAALKTLRERTKSGVMDCQEALKEANGDIDKAIDILYIKAQKKVEKLSKNKTEQNFVFGGVNDKKNTGVLIQLSCQTDFVGNNQDFTRLANEVVQIALDTKPKQATDLLQNKIKTKTIQELINFWIAAFGENIILSDFLLLEGESITCFVHPNKKTGSLVETNKTNTSTQDKDNPAQHVAMQIAINKPMGITQEDVVNKLQEGGKKIPNVEKIAEGKALLTQPFFQKEDQTVSEYLKAIDPELTIKSFVRAPQSKTRKK